MKACVVLFICHNFLTVFSDRLSNWFTKTINLCLFLDCYNITQSCVKWKRNRNRSRAGAASETTIPFSQTKQQKLNKSLVIKHELIWYLEKYENIQLIEALVGVHGRCTESRPTKNHPYISNKTLTVQLFFQLLFHI